MPAYGELDLPQGSAEIGGAKGLTLGDTIDIMVRQNLGIIAMRYEIPMAEADVLTASLRANPVFYADSQLVPYGRYTRASPAARPSTTSTSPIPST